MSLSLKEQLALVRQSLKPVDAPAQQELTSEPITQAPADDTIQPNRVPENMILDAVYEDLCLALDTARNKLVSPANYDMTEAICEIDTVIRDYNGKKPGTVQALLSRAAASIAEGSDTNEPGLIANYCQTARMLLLEATELIASLNAEVANPDALTEDETALSKAVTRAEQILAAAVDVPVSFVKLPVIVQNDSGSLTEQKELSTLLTTEVGLEVIPYLQHLAVPNQKVAVCTDKRLDNEAAKKVIGRAVRKHNQEHAKTYCLMMCNTKFQGHAAAWVVDTKSMKAALNDLHLKWAL